VKIKEVSARELYILSPVTLLKVFLVVSQHHQNYPEKWGSCRKLGKSRQSRFTYGVLFLERFVKPL